MAEKILTTRIQLKYDTLTNWQNSAYNGNDATKYLKAGEIAIVTLAPHANSTPNPQANANQHPLLFKAGTGAHKFDDLPYASALAADVYAWAKQNEATFVANFLNLKTSNNKTMKDVLDGVFATDAELSTAIGGIQTTINGIADRVTALEGKVDVAKVSEAIAAALQTAKDYADANDTAAKELIADNTDAIETIEATIGTYGNIVTHNTSEFATAAQGAKADTALQTHQDISHLATKEEVNTLSGTVATKANSSVVTALSNKVDGMYTNDQIDTKIGEVNTAITNADYASKIEAQGYATTAKSEAIADAKSYTDEVKATILGENDKLVATYDTLSEIGQWIETTGSDVTDLASAIADETKAREEADKAINDSIQDLNSNLDNYMTKATLLTSGSEGRYAILDANGQVVDGAYFDYGYTTKDTADLSGNETEAVAGLDIYENKYNGSGWESTHAGFYLTANKDSGIDMTTYATSGSDYIVEADIRLSDDVKATLAQVEDKMDKLPAHSRSGSEGHYAIFDNNGQVVDGGFLAADVYSSLGSGREGIGFELYEKIGLSGTDDENPLLGLYLEVDSQYLTVTGAIENDGAHGSGIENKEAVVSAKLTLSEEVQKVIDYAPLVVDASGNTNASPQVGNLVVFASDGDISDGGSWAPSTMAIEPNGDGEYGCISLDVSGKEGTDYWLGFELSGSDTVAITTTAETCNGAGVRGTVEITPKVQQKINSAVQEITTIDTSADHVHPSGSGAETNCGGLKATKTGNTVNIEIDDSITFILNCGSAADL